MVPRRMQSGQQGLHRESPAERAQMKTIYKYEVLVDDLFVVKMPRAARLLDVQVQGGTPFVWALVDTDAPLVRRRFALRGTGHPADDLETAAHVGTFQLQNGALVFHLFDRDAEQQKGLDR